MLADDTCVCCLDDVETEEEDALSEYCETVDAAASARPFEPRDEEDEDGDDRDGEETVCTEARDDPDDFPYDLLYRLLLLRPMILCVCVCVYARCAVRFFLLFFL